MCYNTCRFAGLGHLVRRFIKVKCERGSMKQTDDPKAKRPWLWVLASVILLAAAAASSQSTLAQTGAQAAGALDVIEWQVPAGSENCVLTVSGPAGLELSVDFAAGVMPTWQPVAADGAAYPDGTYEYLLNCEISDAAAGLDDGRDNVAQPSSTSTVSVASGVVTVQSGAILTGVEDETEGERGPDAVTTEQIFDDLIVTGDVCVGFYCDDGLPFSGAYHTLVLNEDNTRLRFLDSSTSAGYPSNDWAIIANDTYSGGSNYWAVEDMTAGSRPFVIDAGARTNALHIGSGNHVGIGNANPDHNLVIQDNWNPEIELYLDTSSGWPEQKWIIGGNETNFYIDDRTHGSVLPFRIRPGAPSNSLTVQSSGNVGVGTFSPAYSLEVERTSQDASLALQRTDGATTVMAATADSVQWGSAADHPLEFVIDSSPVMTLTTSGNLALDGFLTELSDVNAKENLVAVDGAEVLARLSQLSISTWNYKAEDDIVRHMGPMAQDFYALYGLGPDNQHIAPLDTNGVALAAAQELYQLTQDQEAQIAELEVANEELSERLAELEALVDGLIQAQQAE